MNIIILLGTTHCDLPEVCRLIKENSSSLASLEIDVDVLRDDFFKNNDSDDLGTYGTLNSYLVKAGLVSVAQETALLAISPPYTVDHIKFLTQCIENPFFLVFFNSPASCVCSHLARTSNSKLLPSVMREWILSIEWACDFYIDNKHQCAVMDIDCYFSNPALLELYVGSGYNVSEGKCVEVDSLSRSPIEKLIGHAIVSEDKEAWDSYIKISELGGQNRVDIESPIGQLSGSVKRLALLAADSYQPELGVDNTYNSDRSTCTNSLDLSSDFSRDLDEITSILFNAQEELEEVIISHRAVEAQIFKALDDKQVEYELAVLQLLRLQEEFESYIDREKTLREESEAGVPLYSNIFEAPALKLLRAVHK